MDAAAALQCLEARLRAWPDDGDVSDLRGRLLELARNDTGSGPWVLSKEFHRLVDSIDRGAFCGSTRGDVAANKELVGDMTAFIKDPFPSPKEMLSAFEEEYEVGINPEDLEEAKPKELEEPAEAKQPDAMKERQLLEERLRKWPDKPAVIDLRERLLELAGVDTGSGPWVLSKSFHRLVARMDRGAFCGATRGNMTAQLEAAKGFANFLDELRRTGFSRLSPEQALSAFDEDFEVGIDPDEEGEAKPKESEEPAEAKRPQAAKERQCLEAPDTIPVYP